MALGTIFAATSAFSQTQGPPTSGPAEDGSPAWFLQGSFPDPTEEPWSPEGGEVTVLPRTGAAAALRAADRLLRRHRERVPRPIRLRGADLPDAECGQTLGECKTHVSQMLAANGGIPSCSHSPVCGNRMTNGVLGPQQGQGSRERQRVQWKQTMGYTFTYPYTLPQGTGGVPSVALDSKGRSLGI